MSAWWHDSWLAISLIEWLLACLAGQTFLLVLMLMRLMVMIRHLHACILTEWLTTRSLLEASMWAHVFGIRIVIVHGLLLVLIIKIHLKNYNIKWLWIYIVSRPYCIYYQNIKELIKLTLFWLDQPFIYFQ